MDLLSNLNLHSNQLQNVVLHPSGTAPTAKTGAVYFDSTAGVHALKVYGTLNGVAAWRTLLDGRAGCVTVPMLADFTTSVSDIVSGGEKIPSTGAVYAYVRDALKTADAMVYMGTVAAAGSSGSIQASQFTIAGSSSSGGGLVAGGTTVDLSKMGKGWTFKVTGSGWFGTVAVEAGDMVIVNQDGAGTTQGSYDVIQTNLTNYVTTLGGVTGAVTLRGGSTAVGDVNLVMSGQELRGTVVRDTPVVTWTGGTTSGPTLKVKAMGNTSTAVAVPSASATASGVVTTGAQTLAGAKTFSGAATFSAGLKLASGQKIGFNGGTSDYLEVVTVDGVKYLHTNLPFYSDSSVSGGGVSGGGTSGGGVVETVLGWSGLGSSLTDGDTTKVFNAYTVNRLWTELGGRIASLEGGSAMTLTPSGAGDVVTGVTKSGTTLTVTKGEASHVALKSFGYLDNRETADFNNFPDSAGLWLSLFSLGAIGNSHAPVNSGLLLQMARAVGKTDGTVNLLPQIAFPTSGQDIWYRACSTQTSNGVFSESWPGWVKLLHSENYTSYVNETNFAGLKKTGTVTSVTITAGTGITVSDAAAITSSGSRTVSLASAYRTKSFAGSVTLKGATESTVTHSLGTRNVAVFLYTGSDSAGWELVMTDVTITDEDTVKLVFGQAQGTASAGKTFKVVVVGR